MGIKSDLGGLKRFNADDNYVNKYGVWSKVRPAGGNSGL